MLTLLLVKTAGGDHSDRNELILIKLQTAKPSTLTLI